MSHIYRTSVAENGLTPLIRRLGRDCLPTQFVREYVRNSIEAIQRTNKPGNILIDVNWDYLDADLTKNYKLSFTDTGDGMTGDEINQYINKLSSSGGENVYENYGMGAKISSITRNPEGIVYESWKDGLGVLAIYRYDESADAYGLEQFELENGSFACFEELNESAMPKLIKDSNRSGTRVTLLGKNLYQDTMDLPEGYIATKESWLYRYLNDRFFDIPDDIKVQVRIGHDRPRENTKHNHLLNVGGQKSVLEKHKEHSGMVQLKGAKVHWWLLKGARQGHGRENVRGHTAFLNQAELFDLNARNNRAVQFGISFGYKDVVLYIEPDEGYVQNTTRTGLVKRNGNPPPVDDWADEFRAKIPNEIQEHIENLMNKSVGASHHDAIKDRLKALQQFYKLSRYKVEKNGAYEVDQHSIYQGKTGGRSNGHNIHLPTPVVPPMSQPGNIKTMLAALTKSGSGKYASKAASDPFPEVYWVSKKLGNRDSDELEDRAATFISHNYTIKANADFIGFTDITDHFLKIFGKSDAAVVEIERIVSEQFEQLLTEVVAGAQSFIGRKCWSPEECQKAVTDEALTAAVMPRFLIMREISRVLRLKLGKPEPSVISEVA
jgi:hypothetical protein